MLLDMELTKCGLPHAVFIYPLRPVAWKLMFTNAFEGRSVRIYDTSLVSTKTFHILKTYTVYTTIYTWRFEDYYFHLAFETSSVYSVVYV
jgi:hypothetical protein